MASLNKAVVIGYLGKEPEVRYSADGIPVCNVTVATSTQWKDKSGEKKSATEWHNIVFYKQLAEIVGSHLHKGSLIYVEGKLKTRKWQNKEGQDRYTTEIVAETMQMLDGAPKDGEKPKAKNNVGNESPAEMADDIPF